MGAGVVWRFVYVSVVCTLCGGDLPLLLLGSFVENTPRKPACYAMGYSGQRPIEL